MGRPPVRRAPIRMLPLLAMVAAASVSGAVLAQPAGGPANAELGTSQVVEVVRYATQGEYTVEQRFWIDTDRTPDAEAAADLAMGVSAGEATVAAQYKVGKRKWAASSLPLQLYYNPEGVGSNPSAANGIQAAISQWNAVTPASFSFTYAGTSARGTGACADTIDADGFNTIQYSTALAFGVLGRTCTLFKTSSSPILEFDMELDAATPWSIADLTPRGSFDLASTILHELGHAAGISHPCENNVQDSKPCSQASPAELASVMFPYLNGGEQRRTLTGDDRDALRAQYPGGPAPTPTAVPTPVVIPPYNRDFSAVVVSLARD